ncbi:alpha-mannosidase [Nakamurella lactea]|uniref:alpha-mannosidase n=1 Tax=Nakamurella lactea TaxID=459515 RepID=UPI000403A693|nr:glycoside hydrolase family 38 C-terminal domain-containing protein [Nakamurella lactea]
MHDRRQLISDRIARALAERIRPAVHRPLAELTLTAWHLDGGQGEPITPAEALAPEAAAHYLPARVGDAWGPAWGTSWFHLTGTAAGVAGGHGDDGDAAGPLELVLDLGWSQDMPGFQAEGLVYRPDGSVIKGLNPRNSWIPVSTGDRIDLYVEAAANPILLGEQGFLPTRFGEKTTAGDAPLYRIARAQLCRLHTETFELVADLEVLDGLMRSLPDSDAHRWELLYALERALDALDLFDVNGTAAGARAELAGLLARPAAPGSHRLSAVGHAHIDSAWLWPVRETVRKVARTVSNVTQLLDTTDDLVYAMSSAQQYEWIEQQRPEVFERLRKHVADGRFVPVGGMWVESDTNMVGGEAMVRQFLYGKRYFLEKFGVEPTQVWLPDSFGYTAALPQIVTLAGCTDFLTQKISWNQVNPFPHHTFWWEGIDGTRVFTHFPPVDTYNSELSGAELAHAAANFRDKGRASRSLVPFGYGDGGGGPTREMLARASRTADLQGSPRVTIESPAAFFEAARADYPDAPVWTGELYLEIHRGTYTSQAKTKQGNRRSEHLLREAELWSATAAVRGLLEYPHDALDAAWKTVLLQQFHDILPGSSIAWVHREAAENYQRVAAELQTLIDTATTALAGAGDRTIAFNAAPVTAAGLPPLSAAEPVDGGAVAAQQDSGSIVLDNGVLRVQIDERGVIDSVRDLRAGREVLPAGGVGNLLQIHPDLPNKWDAWDIDEFYRNTVTDLTEVDEMTLEQAGPDSGGAAEVIVRRSFGASTVQQRIRLEPGAGEVLCTVDIDWQESERVLKAAFDLDVHTDHAAYETQFGHVVRPTHRNTSWDAARFEVCAHRFVHLAEPGYGIAVSNDATYGHDVTRHPRDGGGSYSTVRLSLLRAPRYPDPHTDQGRHVLHYALVPGVDVAGAAAAGYRINLPARRGTGAGPVSPLVSVGEGAMVEAVKLAQDRSGDLIVRLYEPSGARAQVTVTPSFDVAAVIETDLLERELRPDALVDTDPITVALRPFQIVTLRIARDAG